MNEYLDGFMIIILNTYNSGLNLYPRTKSNVKNGLVDSLDNVQIPRNAEGKFNIEMVGGWYGFPLIDFLIKKYGNDINKITIFEADPLCAPVIRKYTQEFKCEHLVNNIVEGDFFDYKEERRAHLVINTSCEHMPNMEAAKPYLIFPERTLLALQSNNMRDLEEHINCVESTKELTAQADIKELHADWQWMTGNGKPYTRYMVMGKWK